MWEHFLSDHGYAVGTAASLEDAQIQWGEDIGLYLVDYYLPDCYGTQAVSQIRQQFPDALVFVVSMDDDADVIRESMRAGGNLYMVKPISTAVMTEILSEIDSGQIDPQVKQLISRHGRRTYNA